MAMDPKARFSDRVADYARFRPGYPEAALVALEEHGGLAVGSRVADVGSGTGILTRRLLERGAEVWAVEPNAPMRTWAEGELAAFPRFHSVPAAAESTGLPMASMDLVTVAQAFHWFDADSARREFRRILRPGGKIALIWNDRLVDSTPFMRALEALIARHGTDFERVVRRLPRAEDYDRLFGSGRWRVLEFANEQRLDRAGLVGRLCSASYVPAKGQPGHEAMAEDIDRLFEHSQSDGLVTLPYVTRLYLGLPADSFAKEAVER